MEPDVPDDPSSSTVWMVHARTGSDGIKGSLTLEGRAVVFRPRYGGTGAETVFALEAIRRVRRVMGSPVLELRLKGSEAGPSPVGFYFAQPPSLKAQEDARLLGRNRAKREAAMTLVQWNAVKKDEVAGWVRNIKAAQRGGS
jgi:hypothetical protein